MFLACEAGVSVKPGASAPGLNAASILASPETGDSHKNLRSFARSRALRLGKTHDPGADAPGFTLTPASQARKTAKTLRIR